MTTFQDFEVDEESSLLDIRRRGKESSNSIRSSNGSIYESDPAVPIGRIRRLADFLGGLVVASAAFFIFHPSGNNSHANTVLPLQQSIRHYSYPLEGHTHHHEPPTLQSNYKKFQALGFQLYTGGAPAVLRDDNGTNYFNSECDGLNSYGKADDFDDADLDLNLTDIHLWQCYLGHTNSKKDVHQRLKIMKDAVDKAEQVSDKDKDVLKIFIAPEFFWRGKDGAYVFYNESDPKGSISKHDESFTQEDIDGDCLEVCHILKGLEAMVADPKYKDWLFLFGTVIVSETLPQEDTYDYLFYNFAPVYRGYDPDETDHYGKRFLVPKRYVSNIDFLTPFRTFHENKTAELMSFINPITIQPQNVIQDDPIQQQTVTVGNPFEMMHGFYDRDMWSDYKDELEDLGYTMLEYDWLILDNITFTIEVCLDHDMHTALNAYLADKVLGSPTLIPKNLETYDPKLGRHTGWIEYVGIPRHQAQLSLVSSSGMTVNPESMALANNGTIILQDGQSSMEGSMTFASECEHSSWHFEGGSEHISRSAKLTPTEITFEYQIHSGHEQHGIWDDLEDLEDATWKDEIEGVFTTARYEPKITVYSPKEIAKV